MANTGTIALKVTFTNKTNPITMLAIEYPKYTALPCQIVQCPCRLSSVDSECYLAFRWICRV